MKCWVSSSINWKQDEGHFRRMLYGSEDHGGHIVTILKYDSCFKSKKYRTYLITPTNLGRCVYFNTQMMRQSPSRDSAMILRQDSKIPMCLFRALRSTERKEPASNYQKDSVTHEEDFLPSVYRVQQTSLFPVPITPPIKDAILNPRTPGPP